MATDYSWVGDDVGEWDGDEPSNSGRAEGAYDPDDIVVLYDARNKPLVRRYIRIGYVVPR